MMYSIVYHVKPKGVYCAFKSNACVKDIYLILMKGLSNESNSTPLPNNLCYDICR